MKQQKNIAPPEFADKFLGFYCKSSLIEEIQGDLYELFDKRVASQGLRWAQWRFVWEVIRFFKWSNLKRSKSYKTNHTAMLKNYFKVGFRNLKKTPTTAFINIFGLALSIGCAIVVFLFLDFQYSMDSYHKDANNIYQVTNYVIEDNGESLWGKTPVTLKEAITHDIPQVTQSARVEAKRAIFKFDGEVFHERVSFADAEFFEIFSFPILYGNLEGLYKENNIVISKTIAEKYFARRDPIGKEVEIIFNKTHKELFTVIAVADTPPVNSSFEIDVFIPFHHYNRIYDFDTDDWANFVDVTFIQVKEGSSIDAIQALMNEKYINIQNEAEEDWKVARFSSVILPELSLSSYKIDYSFSMGSHPGGRIAMAVVAILLLLLSCFNYMNIAVVSATSRLKEIGLRKVMGGNRGEIIRQFLVENILISFISAMVGLGFAYYFLLPGFNRGLPFEIPFEFSSNLLMITFFVGLLLFIGVVSGAYPAFYISSFNPASIFRGNQKFGKKNFFSKLFLVFQFALAFITILSGVIFTQNSNYQRDQDWGYNEAQVIGIPIESKKHYAALRNKLTQNPDIELVSGSASHVGKRYSLINLEFQSQKLQTASFEVGFDYLETLGLKLDEGRSFDKNIESDKIESIIVTELFVKKMGWENALNQELKMDSNRYFVVGVLSNFHFDSFYDKMIPAVFTITPEENFRYIAMKVAAGKVSVTEEYIAGVWKEVEPDLPYDGFLQSEVFDYFFNEMRANNELMAFIAGMALVLACMGLYGLVSFNISRKMKEYSIRRVLGANLTSIGRSVNNDFVWYLIIAGIISAPAAYYLMDMLLNSIFELVMPMTAWPFIIAFGSVIFTAYLTISSQIFKVSRSNPADTLRNE